MADFTRQHKNSLTDQQWADFYCALLATGRDRLVFTDTPRTDVPGFIRMVRNPAEPWWMFFYENEPCAIAYLNGICGKRAWIHYACLPMPKMRDSQGIPMAIAVIRFGVASILHDRHADGNYIMDVLVGNTPVWNRPAMKVLRKCGADIIGAVPDYNYCCDSERNSTSIISYFSRKTVPAEWCEK